MTVHLCASLLKGLMRSVITQLAGLCYLTFFATLWAVAHRLLWSMEFYRQEYWSGLLSANLVPPTLKMGFSTCHSRSQFLAREPQPTSTAVKGSISPVPETFHACQPPFSHRELFLAQGNPVKFFHHSMGNNFSIRLESQYSKYVTSL